MSFRPTLAAPAFSKVKTQFRDARTPEPTSMPPLHTSPAQQSSGVRSARKARLLCLVVWRAGQGYTTRAMLPKGMGQLIEGLRQMLACPSMPIRASTTTGESRIWVSCHIGIACHTFRARTRQAHFLAACTLKRRQLTRSENTHTTGLQRVQHTVRACRSRPVRRNTCR